MKIDAFSHIFPRSYFDKMVEIAPDKGAIKRWLHIPVLYDLDARLKMMEEFGKDYQQILTLSLPAIETVAKPDQSPALARLANDGMAAIVKQRPDRFPAFVASIGMNNVPEALKEMKRAIEDMGACGIQIFTNVNGRPLDEPEFWPIFEKMAEYDLPIWMHPTRGAGFADYPTEKKSKFEIWWTFGWPYETSAAMARMVFSKFFIKLPKLKIITHHLGAMAPYFEGRVGHGWDQLGTRTADEDYAPLLKELGRPITHFKKFYGDTSLSGSQAGIECGLNFFGIDQVVFGADCPFDPEGGPLFIREIIQAINNLDIPETDRKKIYEDNIRRLVRTGPKVPKF